MLDIANWKNPETLMLNITNAMLGLAVVFLVCYILWNVLHNFKSFMIKEDHK